MEITQNLLSLFVVAIISNPEFIIVMSVVALLIGLTIIGVIFYNRYVPAEVDADEYYKNEYLNAEAVKEEPVEVKEVHEEVVEEPVEETAKEEVQEEPVEEEVKEEPMPVEPTEVVVEDKVVTPSSVVLNIIIEENYRELVRRKPLSFENRVRKSNDDLKRRYSEIKNHLLSYKGITSRMSHRFDTFRRGRKVVTKIAVIGNNLKVYLAIDQPTELPSKYYVYDASHIKAYEKVPAFLRVRSDRATKYAKDLITMIMQDLNLEQIENFESIDYPKLFPPISEAELEELQPVLGTVMQKLDTPDVEISNSEELVSYLNSLSDASIISMNIVTSEVIDEERDVADVLNEHVIVNKSELIIHFKNGDKEEQVFTVNEDVVNLLKTFITDKDVDVTIVNN